jgi:exodeoxyribonuclease V alpha subunit
MSRLTPLGTVKERFVRSQSPAKSEGLAWALHEEESGYLGWEIARCARGLSPHESRAIALLAAACLAAVREGSTRLPLDERRLSEALARLGEADESRLLQPILERARLGDPGDPVTLVLGRPGERKPLVLDGDWLYTERMRGLEDRFCARVRDRLARSAKTRDSRGVARALSAVAAGPPMLTEEQKRAVREALAAPLALISGGPGTGKTMIVAALLRALAWMGEPMPGVAIAAPTGKAAQRLRETIASGRDSPSHNMVEATLRTTAPTPQTINRLLGWSPSTGRFARHENDPLPHKWVVVDEASMIDLSMMERLMRALRADARIVLLGDADQLPSVDAGAVFRDLCAALRPVRLSKNLRVSLESGARRIVSAADAVNRGEVGPEFADCVVTRQNPAEVAFEGVEHLAAPWAEVGDCLLRRWWNERIASFDHFAPRTGRSYRLAAGEFDATESAELCALLDHHASSRVLCATRAQGAATSADSINERLIAKFRAKGAPAHARGHCSLWAPGAPVVIERNDYDRELFNGDQGVVVRAGSEQPGGDELLAVFRRGDSLRAFPAEALTHLAPCLAMTVHKAQGSEFDRIVLVLPDVDLPLLTRELVYTAMTRARRSVLIVGRQELLARAVSRTLERHSGISERLRKHAE